MLRTRTGVLERINLVDGNARGKIIVRRVSKIAKSDCYLRHVRPYVLLSFLSVRLHGTTQLPLDGF